MIFHLFLSPSGGVDFGPFPAPTVVLTVVLLGNETRLEYGVVILEDSIVEAAEQFTARLELQEGTIGVLLGERNEAVVVIEDNDCECVEYEQGICISMQLYPTELFGDGANQLHHMCMDAACSWDQFLS